MKNFKIALTATIISLGLGLFFSSCDQEPIQGSELINIEGITNYKIIELDKEDIFNTIGEQAGNSEIKVDLSHVNPEWVFTMEEQSVYTEDAQIVEITEHGVKDVELEEAFFLSGNDVAGRLSLMISRKSNFCLQYAEGNALFMIQSLSRYSSIAKDNQYIVYTNHDVLNNVHEDCGSVSHGGEALTSSGTDGSETTVNLENRSVTPTRFVEMSSIGEGSYYQEVTLKGVSPWQEISDIAFLGGARYWFYSDFDLKPLLKYNGVYTSGYNVTSNAVDPNDAGHVVNEWVAFGSRNGWFPKKDAHVLFTSRAEINGGGAAKGLGKVCSNQAHSYFFQKYAHTDYFVLHQLFAHELAHLLNAGHFGADADPSCTECDGVNGGGSRAQFSTKAKQAMETYISANDSCL